MLLQKETGQLAVSFFWRGWTNKLYLLWVVSVWFLGFVFNLLKLWARKPQYIVTMKWKWWHMHHPFVVVLQRYPKGYKCKSLHHDIMMHVSLCAPTLVIFLQTPSADKNRKHLKFKTLKIFQLVQYSRMPWLQYGDYICITPKFPLTKWVFLCWLRVAIWS